MSIKASVINNKPNWSFCRQPKRGSLTSSEPTVLQKWYKLQCLYVTAFSGSSPFGAALHTSASVLDEPSVKKKYYINLS